MPIKSALKNTLTDAKSYINNTIHISQLGTRLLLSAPIGLILFVFLYGFIEIFVTTSIGALFPLSLTIAILIAGHLATGALTTPQPEPTTELSQQEAERYTDTSYDNSVYSYSNDDLNNKD